jgi:hypothetical protein
MVGGWGCVGSMARRCRWTLQSVVCDRGDGDGFVGVDESRVGSGAWREDDDSQVIKYRERTIRPQSTAASDVHSVGPMRGQPSGTISEINHRGCKWSM